MVAATLTMNTTRVRVMTNPTSQKPSRILVHLVVEGHVPRQRGANPQDIIRIT
jgi:hypothetical protein